MAEGKDSIFEKVIVTIFVIIGITLIFFVLGGYFK